MLDMLWESFLVTDAAVQPNVEPDDGPAKIASMTSVLNAILHLNPISTARRTIL